MGDACSKGGERLLQGPCGEFDSHRLHIKIKYGISKLYFKPTTKKWQTLNFN